jgi:hypothetical protein
MVAALGGGGGGGLERTFPALAWTWRHVSEARGAPIFPGNWVRDRERLLVNKIPGLAGSGDGARVQDSSGGARAIRHEGRKTGAAKPKAFLELDPDNSRRRAHLEAHFPAFDCRTT